MTALAQGQSTTFVLAHPASISFSVDGGEIVILSVSRSGRVIFAQPITRSMSFGPFQFGDSVTITAQRGAADYFLSNQQKIQRRSRAPFGRLKTLPELAFMDADGRSYRQIWQVPFTGLCKVRAGYETDATSAGSITNVAFAGGRAITDVNPLDAAGAAATWTAIAGPALTAASATLASDGKLGGGVSSFVTVDVPAAADGSGGGFIYVGTQSNAASRRWHVSLPSIDYEDYINALIPGLRYRCMANASGDNVSTNQNAFVNAAVGGSSWLRGYHAATFIDVIPLNGDILSFTMCGDSTLGGYGNGATNPMGYSPGTIVAGMLNSAGIQCVMDNIGSIGAGARYFNQRLMDRLNNDSDFRPDFVVLQPFTSNDVFTTAAISAGIGYALESAKMCAAKGIKVFLTTVTGASGDDAAKIAARNAGNAQVRASSWPVIDLDSILTNPATGLLYPALTTDGTHYTRAAQELAASLYRRVITEFALTT